MLNWKTIEEARKTNCRHSNLLCETDKCSLWVWEGCSVCDSTGEHVIVKSATSVVTETCKHCKDTEGNLGRCGSIHGSY